MSVKPRVVGPRMLVKKLEPAEMTAGRVVLPQETRAREVRGIVYAVGDAWNGRDSPAEVGDVVVWDDTGRTPYGQGPPPIRVVLDLAEDGKAEEFVVVEWGEVLVVLEQAPVEAR